ncbi:MAG: hypothetical protein ACTSUX_06375 [Promethearchaeota archaeon]
MQFDLKRVKEAEEYLRDYNKGQDIFERVYRSYHGSYKIIWARYDAIYFLYLSLYILKLVNKTENDEEKLIKAIKPCLKKPFLTEKIFSEMVKNDFMKVKKAWYDIEDHIIPYLGYLIFFKTILECLIEYAHKRTGNEPYGRFIEYFEGTAEYFIGDLYVSEKKKDKISNR